MQIGYNYEQKNNCILPLNTLHLALNQYDLVLKSCLKTQTNVINVL